MEEPLPDSLVNYDQCVFGEFRLLNLLAVDERVFLMHYLIQLFKLMRDNLLSHGVADAVSVDENVVGQGSVVVLSECLEGTLEILLKHTGTDNLLALLALRTGLSVVLAHVFIVGRTESNDGLLALVAHVDSDQHRFLGDL